MKIRRDKSEADEAGFAPGEPELPQEDPVEPPQELTGDESSEEVRELLAAEREARELLDQRRNALRSGELAEAQRQLKAAEERFAEDRAELETELTEARSQWVAGVRESYEQAQQELEAERSRASLLETQRDEALARVEAGEREVEEARSEAEQWVTGIRESYEQTQQEVKLEQSRAGELEGRLGEESQALEAARSEAEQSRSEVERLAGELSAAQAAAAEPVQVPEPPPEPAVVIPQFPEQNERPGRLFRRRAGRKEEGAACSACMTPKPPGTPAELAQLGWIDRGDVSLCPDCQAAGWKLLEGASVPSRRLSDRP